MVPWKRRYRGQTDGILDILHLLNLTDTKCLCKVTAISTIHTTEPLRVKNLAQMPHNGNVPMLGFKHTTF